LSILESFMPIGRFLSLALCVFLISLPHAFAADESDSSSDEKRAEHLQRMKDVASSIEFRSATKGPKSAMKLVEEPVLRYTDNTRKIFESSLWIWSAGGRPNGVLAVEYYPEDPRGSRWLFEIASLSPERVAVEYKSELNWTAKRPGLKLQTLSGQSPPAEKPTRRLSQMKEICRQFTMFENELSEGRIELRLLTSPLYRYTDPDAGVLDGAIFGFTNGTNPEVLLLLEAHREKDREPTWQYSLAQMTGAAVKVELADKEVWTCDGANPPAVRDSYVNGWIASETTEK
jgi:hypothetical protein